MFAMGIKGLVPNMFSFLSGVIVPQVYNQYGLMGSSFVGVILVFVSCILTAIFLLIDRKTENYDKDIS